MTSRNFSRLSDAASDNGWTIDAVADAPDRRGSYPAAFVLAFNSAASEYVVTVGVLPNDGGSAFFTDSEYIARHDDATDFFHLRHSRGY